MWRRTFLDVRGLINGSNLLVLLDAIYPESTVELFENLYRQQISESYMNFKAFFFHIFSFTYESRYKKFSISSNLDATYRFPQQCEPKRAPDTITTPNMEK